MSCYIGMQCKTTENDSKQHQTAHKITKKYKTTQNQAKPNQTKPNEAKPNPKKKNKPNQHINNDNDTTN